VPGKRSAVAPPVFVRRLDESGDPMLMGPRLNWTLLWAPRLELNSIQIQSIQPGNRRGKLSGGEQGDYCNCCACQSDDAERNPWCGLSLQALTNRHPRHACCLHLHLHSATPREFDDKPWQDHKGHHKMPLAAPSSSSSLLYCASTPNNLCHAD